ncbi:MAG: PAS domain S-box protein, partial [Alphaproteobacteria bacterium]|nr:PAS domain S-box protein [Alphaproteobacteria bacterium]
MATVVTMAGMRLSKELDALASAPRDNVQWVLSELEVAVWRLHHTVHEAGKGAVPLGQVRLQFDNLYNRLSIVEHGQAFSGMRERQVAANAVKGASETLKAMAPYIDGPDRRLLESLPLIESRLEELGGDVRTIALDGIAYFAGKTDQKRLEFTHVLGVVGYSAVGLIAALAMALIVMVLQFRTLILRDREVGDHQRRFELTFNAATDAIIVVGQNGRILDCNAAAERLFEFQREAVRGRDMGDLIIPERFRSLHEKGFAEYLQTGQGISLKSRRMEVTALKTNGIEFPAEISVSTAQWHGELIFIGFARDISARRRAQEAIVVARDKALAADRAKTDFIAVVSHEMRTPLNGLIGLLDLLQRAGDLNGQQRRYLETAIDSGELLMRQINNVLDITRVETGNIELANQALNLGQMMDRAASLNEPIATRMGTTIAHGSVPDNLAIAGDPHLTEQVLLNLVGNAAKFTMNGTIAIAAAVISETDKTVLVEVSVQDTGIGISKADQERVFEEFVTLDTSYGRTTGGSGLGLSICRRLVELMGGTIGVESEPGVGSRFWFRIPFHRLPAKGRRDAAAAEREAMAGDESVRFNILVVDDNEINLLVAGEMARGLGHTVTAVGSGQAAIDAARVEAFDVILMDISMPGMDGFAAAKRIRDGDGLSCNAVMIAQTAHAAPEEQARREESGLVSALIKPFRTSDLEAALQDAMARKRKQSAAGKGAVRTVAAVTGNEASEVEPALDPAKIEELRMLLGEEA